MSLEATAVELAQQLTWLQHATVRIAESVERLAMMEAVRDGKESLQARTAERLFGVCLGVKFSQGLNTGLTEEGVMQLAVQCWQAAEMLYDMAGEWEEHVAAEQEAAAATDLSSADRPPTTGSDTVGDTQVGNLVAEVQPPWYDDVSP